jgi:L-alanine-DL-glutamate epimerase-like enolase superfamily enzyme
VGFTGFAASVPLPGLLGDGVRRAVGAKDSMVTKVEVFALSVPLKEPFTISLGTMTAAENVLVRIHTAGGLVGLGECSPFVFIDGQTQGMVFDLARDVAKVLVGKDALAVDARLAEIERAAPGNPTMKSAYDMALFDLLGKAAGLPLYVLLGGGGQQQLHTDLTISINTPEVMARKARELLDRGFTKVKTKVGRTTEQDVASISAIRKAVGPGVPIQVDANQGWDVPTAVRTLEALAEYDVLYCEEPIRRGDLEALRYVRERSPIPIMADESVFDHKDAFRIAANGAADYFNIKLSKSGGIANAIRINAIAEAAAMKCQVGCMQETRLALTALAHVAAAKANIVFYDLDSALFHSEDPVVGGLVYGERGSVELPDAPGIGADVDPAFLRRMESATV